MGSPQMYDAKNLSLESKLEKFKVYLDDTCQLICLAFFKFFPFLGNFQKSCRCEEKFCYNIGFPFETNNSHEITAAETHNKCV